MHGKMSFTTIFDTARGKILGTGRSADADMGPILLCRLALGFSRTVNGFRLAEEMARMKMAHVLYVPEHREYPYATYGSECVPAFKVASPVAGLTYVFSVLS